MLQKLPIICQHKYTLQLFSLLHKHFATVWQTYSYLPHALLNAAYYASIMLYATEVPMLKIMLGQSAQTYMYHVHRGGNAQNNHIPNKVTLYPIMHMTMLF